MLGAVRVCVLLFVFVRDENGVESGSGVGTQEPPNIYWKEEE